MTGKKKSFQKGASGGVALTDGQRMQIQALEERDLDFDNQLDQIGEGIMDLAEIAEQQGEEVKRQSAMLDNVTCVFYPCVVLLCLQQLWSNLYPYLPHPFNSEKVEAINERVVNVNARMKETLDEVGRSSDKLCVDIMCIVLAIGFGSVFYNMSKGSI
jgi:hypothetical protein